MDSTPANLSPMETLLLASLQASSDAHEKRLSELEGRLAKLSEQSKTDSDSAQNAFTSLSNQLEQLSKQLNDLETRLKTYAADSSTLAKKLEEKRIMYNKAVESFNSMKAQYKALASEVQQLRKSVES